MSATTHPRALGGTAIWTRLRAQPSVVRSSGVIWAMKWLR